MEKYFRGKLVRGISDRGSYYSPMLMRNISYCRIYLEGEAMPFLWNEEKHERLTTETPAAYRNFTRPQLTEDIADV